MIKLYRNLALLNNFNYLREIRNKIKDDMQELIDYISTHENIKFIALIGDVKDKLANLLKEKKYL